VTRESVSLLGVLVLGDQVSGSIASKRPIGFGPKNPRVCMASLSGRVWVNIAALNPRSRLEISRTKGSSNVQNFQLVTEYMFQPIHWGPYHAPGNSDDGLLPGRARRG